MSTSMLTNAPAPVGLPREYQARESSASAVAWPAVLAGALVAVAATILLVALGSGLGLSSVSLWSGSNPSLTTFSVMAAIWLIVVQWLASGLGGYVTGRMRVKWAGVHAHEVFFRDTANGLLAWAVASIVVVGFTVAAGSAALSGATNAVSTVAAGAASGASQMAQGSVPSDPGGYLMDVLFRPAQPTGNASGPAPIGEASRIIATGIGGGTISPADRTYLAQIVSARTGLSQADAEKRIDDVVGKVNAAADRAKQAADVARKAASSFGFLTCLSMLIGAFVASAAAALGGRERDLL